MNWKNINGFNLIYVLLMIISIILNSALSIYILIRHREISGFTNYGIPMLMGLSIGGMLNSTAPKWSRVVMGLFLPAAFVLIFSPTLSLNFDLSQINFLEKSFVILLWILMFIPALLFTITAKYSENKTTQK